MLKPSRVAAAVGITVLLTGLGCSRDPLAGRGSLDLEQALHGHWSSTRDLVLAPSADSWDTTGATEQWHAEIDRYINCQSDPKAWSEMAGDRNWQTQSQEPASDVIVVESWPLGRRAKTMLSEFKVDADRLQMLEKLPAQSGKSSLREWIYINADASP